MKNTRPEPLPAGTPIYSSGSGWIHHNGQRARPVQGVVITPLVYVDKRDDRYRWDAPCWTYLVLWENLHRPTRRSSRTMCPLTGLEALATAADDYVPLCWMCGEEAKYHDPCGMCKAHYDRWVSSELSMSDVSFIKGPIRDVLETRVIENSS